ncbi:hypothetical protein [uncultured Kordia sp.]|uniref:hypothetical protein n=1 Tax=uncultured Kordia sp. TaxID=507699 RepID=UPI00263619A4|nr:hypothetical protein [uncultured Kordia sp.]
MKKRDLNGLKLNKKSISNLNPGLIIGGKFTAGCSDGCTPFQTAWNCTRTECSDDCGNGASFIGTCITTNNDLQQPQD